MEISYDQKAFLYLVVWNEINLIKYVKRFAENVLSDLSVCQVKFKYITIVKLWPVPVLVCLA